MHLHRIGALVHPYQIGETIYQYRSEALMSFWAISTLVHMGHGAQIFWNQSRALLYFVFFYTWVHIGIEALVHLDQCGSSMCLDQCLELMYF
jgi:hypothetical protein